MAGKHQLRELPYKVRELGWPAGLGNQRPASDRLDRRHEETDLTDLHSPFSVTGLGTVLGKTKSFPDKDYVATLHLPLGTPETSLLLEKW